MRIGKRIPRLASAALFALAAACGGENEEAPAADAAATDATASPPAGATAPAATPSAGGNLPAGATPEMVQQGQQIFVGAGNCFTCHGQNGEGGPLAPSLQDNQWLWFEGTPQMDELVTLIKTGVTQPKEHPAPMPAMGGAQLSDEQLQAVSAYVLSIAQG